MATDHQSHLELFDVSKKPQVAEVRLASIRVMPQIGERIFLPWANREIEIPTSWWMWNTSLGSIRPPASRPGPHQQVWAR